VSDLPTTANVVVIGSASSATQWSATWPSSAGADIVQFDKGPLPNPGGSTGHASNFIFPVDHNREMAALTLDSHANTRRWGSTPRAAASRSHASPNGSRSSGGA